MGDTVVNYTLEMEQRSSNRHETKVPSVSLFLSLTCSFSLYLFFFHSPSLCLSGLVQGRQDVLPRVYFLVLSVAPSLSLSLLLSHSLTFSPSLSFSLSLLVSHSISFSLRFCKRATRCSTSCVIPRSLCLPFSITVSMFLLLPHSLSSFPSLLLSLFVPQVLYEGDKMQYLVCGLAPGASYSFRVKLQAHTNESCHAYE